MPGCTGWGHGNKALQCRPHRRKHSVRPLIGGPQAALDRVLPQLLRTAQPSHSKRVLMNSEWEVSAQGFARNICLRFVRVRLSSALLLVACGTPGLVRVVKIHALEDCKRIGA